MTDIIDELTWRGLISQSTDLDELRKALASGPVTLYGGFDPTAPGLHIGNLVPLLTMRRFQAFGHRPIGLVGGATGLIGDPSGKSAERVLNPREVVTEWVDRIRVEVERLLEFGDIDNSAVIVSNLDWTDGLSTLDFLRDIGKHFPVNQMLARESVKARLEAGGISYTEFSYQILQALDYLELYRRRDCTLQLGGSDQWGNLVAGVDLIRRAEGGSVHALATPLITKPDGTKYGKTGGGAIWISPDLMSPYAFYQFWLNVSDVEVPGLLKVFTFRSRGEIEELERQTAERPAARVGQRTLAQDVTTLVHSADATQRVMAASRALFGQGELAEIDEHTLADAFAEVPHTEVFLKAEPAGPGDGGGDTGPGQGGLDEGAPDQSGLGPGGPDQSGAGPGGPGRGGAGQGGMPTVADLMALTGIVASKSAARRAIAGGGAYLNNRKVTSEDAVPERGDLLHDRYLIVRRGKRTVGAVDIRPA